MKKGIVLVVVLGVLIVLSILAIVALSLMTQESRIAEHKIKRMRAFYAAQAGEIHALEQLRKGQALDPSITVGAGITGYPAAGYNVVINRVLGTGPGGSDTINATVNY